MKKNNHFFDTFLVLLIISSVAFIAERVYWTQKKEVSQKQNTAIATAITTQTPTPQTTWYDWISSFRFVPDINWNDLVASTPVRNLTTSSTSKCKTPNSLKLESLLIDTNLAVKKFQDGELRVSFDPANRLCIAVGNKVDVLAISSAPNSPILTHLGSVTIQTLMSLTIGQWPPNLLMALGLENENLNEHFARTTPGVETVTLVRWSAPQKTAPVTPPRGHNIAIPTSRTEFASLIERGAKFVDLREVESSSLSSNKDYLHAPFTMRGQTAYDFNFKVTVRDVQEASFDAFAIVRALADRSKPIVLFGPNKMDGRPIWAALLLRKLNLSNVYWAHEGAEAVESYFSVRK